MEYFNRVSLVIVEKFIYVCLRCYVINGNRPVSMENDNVNKPTHGLLCITKSLTKDPNHPLTTINKCFKFKLRAFSWKLNKKINKIGKFK